MIILSSLFFLFSLVMLSPFVDTSLSNALALTQGDEYDAKSADNKKYDDKRISLYPTKVNKYECQTGSFEGFFVSSVEFCKEVPIINVNGIATQRSISTGGPQIIQVSTEAPKTIGLSSPNQVEEANLYFREGNLATTNTTSPITSVAFCAPGDEIVEGFYQLTNEQDNPILGFINQITGEKNTYSSALISTNVTLQSTAFCFNNNHNNNNS